MVLFDLEKHRYKELGGADLTSVTRVISKYYEEFDTEVISARVAKKRGVSQESLKAEWAQIGEVASARGKIYHALREEENLRNKNVIRSISTDEYKLGLSLENLLPGIYPELILYHLGFSIAGTADKVEILEDKEFNLVDYKTNVSLDFESFKVYDPKTYTRKPKMMYAPVAHLEDCNWNHYCLQLSMYAYFLEQHGYSLSDMWIEHAIFDEENVVVDTIKYYVPYLKKEVEDICKDHLVKAFIDGEGRN